MDFLEKWLVRFMGGRSPDPYYGGYQGFEQVLDLIEEASESLMKFLLQKAKA
jgi:protein-tyrosine-phosphatase